MGSYSGQVRERRVSDLAVSLIRTWVPIAVGAALTWAARRWGIVLPDELGAEAAVWATAAVAALYYALARWLERRTGSGLTARAGRWAGRWMLGGVIRQPVYADRGERVVVVDGQGGMRAPR
jgi:hypothetical protein